MKNNQQASVIIWQRLVASTGHSFVYKKKLNGIFNEYTVQFLFWWNVATYNRTSSSTLKGSRISFVEPLSRI
nr:MAG TPA: hypothetical protein [Caudoviricetes sp.]